MMMENNFDIDLGFLLVLQVKISSKEVKNNILTRI